MKLTNILGQTNRSFASVFLAFSLFGFLFPHQANRVKENHQVRLTSLNKCRSRNRLTMDQYTSGSIDSLKGSAHLS